MDAGRLDSSALSGRQVWVTVFLCGLSAAAGMGGANWLWLLLFSCVMAGLLCLLLALWKPKPLKSGALSIIYKVWSALLAARALSGAAGRIAFTAEIEEEELWVLLLLGAVLLWLCRGKAAAFFRAAEILWLLMAAVLGLLLVFGAAKTQLHLLLAPPGGWRSALLLSGEIFTPAVFVLPYLYKVEGERGRERSWLAALALTGTVMAALTAGIFGRAAEDLRWPFFASMGVLASSARWEGTLSVVWVVTDLLYAALLCRVWGKGWRVLVGCTAGIALAILKIPDRIPGVICLAGTGILALAAFFLGGTGKRIVVDF